MPFKYASLKDRLEANSRTIKGPLKTPCRIWVGRRNNAGYGMMSRRKENGKVDSVSVHKVAFMELWEKKIPKGKEISHLCHREACWQKDHMIAETHEQNLARNDE